jgi:hypothetical protein
VYYYLGLRVLNHLPGFERTFERELASDSCLTPDLMYRYTRGYLLGTVTPRDLIFALVLGLSLTLLGCLLPIPAYFIGTALGSRHHGLIAACCAALIPSLLIFIPSIDGFAAVLALATVAAWLWALRTQNWGTYALAGLLMFLAVFWSIGLGAVVVCLAVVAIPYLRQPTNRQTLRGAAIAVGVFGLIFLLLNLCAGYSLLGNLRLIMQSQRGEMHWAHRDYLTWLGMNLWDLPLFFGAPLLALALTSLIRLKRLTAPVRAYVAGVFLTLAVVWLSGSTLAEVGRIWLFLMALLAPAAAAVLADLPSKPRSAALTLVMLGQVLLALVMHCTLTLVHP